MTEDYDARGQENQSRYGEPFFTGWESESEEDKKPKPVPIDLRHIADIVAEQREPAWLIHKVIEANVLAVLAGPRSTFKSFIALDWAMHMAVAGHAGVILSGEGGGLAACRTETFN